MDVKDVVALLEFLPKTILAVTVLVTLVAFHKPISERLLPKVQSFEFAGAKLAFVKEELKSIEKEKVATLGSELGWSLDDKDFDAIRDRANHLAEHLSRMHLIWVDDDHPAQNLRERRALNALGVSVDPVKTTDEAIHLLDCVFRKIRSRSPKGFDRSIRRIRSGVGA